MGEYCSEEKSILAAGRKGRAATEEAIIAVEA